MNNIVSYAMLHRHHRWDGFPGGTGEFVVFKGSASSEFSPWSVLMFQDWPEFQQD